MDFDIAVSWVLYSIREILGIDSLRNQILASFIKKEYLDQITLGRTFGSDSKFQQMQSYLQDLIIHQINKRYTIFTGINRPQYGETHYQGFIVDQLRKILYIADPAYTRNGPGIYKPYLAELQVIPLFKKQKYQTVYIPLTNPCQMDMDDVFCQSWTLYIMIEFINHRFETVRIPESAHERYHILKKFYKKILKSCPDFCPLLQEYYLYNVSKHRSVVSHISNTQQRKEFRNELKSVDPCKILSQIKTKNIQES